MKKRDKVYYPTSQIITGLYTSGSEYEDEKGNEYIGPYHSYINGATYSESTYIDNKSFPISKILREHKDNKFYTKLTSKKYYSDDVIRFNSITSYIPTEEDRKNKYYLRYFIKRKNTREFRETDKKTFDILKDNKMFLLFHDIFTIKWFFLNPEHDFIRNNIIVNKGYKDENNRNINILDIKYPGFRYYLIGRETLYKTTEEVKIENERIFKEETQKSQSIYRGIPDGSGYSAETPSSFTLDIDTILNGTGIMTEDNRYILTENDQYIIIE